MEPGHLFDSALIYSLGGNARHLKSRHPFVLIAGFPCSIKSIKKVLNFKVSSQDLEKVLTLAKIWV